ncbi:hypothetical protein C2E23DRAFT_886995 [Lenzites betulinus]|nr:hypothetical protein C2E23DRAFT_886995 [Lenzites betulinus]
MFNFKLVVLALTVALIGTSSAAPASAPQDEAVILSRGTDGLGSVTPSVATGLIGGQAFGASYELGAPNSESLEAIELNNLKLHNAPTSR